MQMMQMYGTFEGFPFEKSALIELVIFHDPWINTFNQEAMATILNQKMSLFPCLDDDNTVDVSEIRLTS